MLHHYDTNFSQNQPHSYEQFLYDNGLHHERVKLMGLRGRNKKQLKISEAVLQRCFYKKVFWKYAANLQENTEITFRHGCSPVNLYIFRAIFLRTSLKGCFWKLSLLFFFSKFFFRIFKISVTLTLHYRKCFTSLFISFSGIVYSTEMIKISVFTRCFFQVKYFITINPYISLLRTECWLNLNMNMWHIYTQVKSKLKWEKGMGECL